MNKQTILFGAGLGLVLVIAAAWAARRAALPGGLLDQLNPLNPDNVFSRTADAVTESVTGDPSFGGWLAEIFNPEVRAANEAMRAPVVLGGPPVYDYGDIGLGADVAMGSGGPVFAETEGGAVTGIWRR